MYAQIKENVQMVRENIAKAAKKSGRNAEDIKLIAVTKTIDIPGINELLSADVTLLGENKVQELLSKYDGLDSRFSREWHFIGHLQTNKVKFIIDKVSMIHSVDSIRLVSEINKRACQAGIVAGILIELNIADEAAKYGIKPDEIYNFIEQLYDFKNIRPKGLMAMAPYTENPENNRVYFEKIYNLHIDIKEKYFYNVKSEEDCFDELSIGMSGDYEVAVECGATMVRIGTALFGSRVHAAGHK